MEKIWFITTSGRPVSLNRRSNGEFSEDIKLSMMLSQQRMTLNLEHVAEAEVIAPFNFRGRPVMMHLISITAGIMVGGIMQLDPVLSAIVLLTFAASTLLFQIDFSPPHRLVRVNMKNGRVQCIVVKDEDVEKLLESVPVGKTMTDPAPRDFNENEIAQMDAKRYGLVTIICSACILFLLNNIKTQKSADYGLYAETFTYIVTVVAATIAAVGCYRIITSTLRLQKKRQNSQ